MQDVYVGIDFGTTNIKVASFSRQGEMLQCLREKTPLQKTACGEGYLPEQVFSIVENLLQQVRQRFLVDGVAVTGMSEAGVLMDRETHRELSELIPWFDKRTVSLAEKYQTQEQEGFVHTGLRNSYKYGVYKYLWTLKTSGRKKEQTLWLSACDWLVMRLTGVCATDPTFAARTYLYDVAKQSWSEERLNWFGVEYDSLPQVFPSGTVIGYLRPELFSDGRSVPVTLGGHDHLCAAFAASQAMPDCICDSMGTAETFVGTREAQALTPEQMNGGLTFGPFVEPGKQYWMANIPSAGLSIEWARKQMHRSSVDYEEMETVLQSTEDGGMPLFFPWLTGTGTPHYMNGPGGVFWGLTDGTDWRKMLSSVVTGLCLWERYVLLHVPEAEGKSLCVMGGAANSPTWMQRKANILQKPVFCSSIKEGTMLGAVEQMCRNCDLPFQIPEDSGVWFQPDEQKAKVYDSVFQEYCELAELFQNHEMRGRQ